MPITLTAPQSENITESPARSTRVSDRPLVVPFTVLADDRECAAGWRFVGLRADSRNSYRPLAISVRYTRLLTGDYTIEGLEHLVAIERKSLVDLFGSLANSRDDKRRDRFKAEHERMSQLAFAAVIIEADWSTILQHPPANSQLDPASVLGTAVSWQQRYGVHWEAAGGRQLAEERTFRHLRMFWEHRQKLAGSSQTNSQQNQPKRKGA